MPPELFRMITTKKSSAHLQIEIEERSAWGIVTSDTAYWRSVIKYQGGNWPGGDSTSFFSFFLPLVTHVFILPEKPSSLHLWWIQPDTWLFHLHPARCSVQGLDSSFEYHAFKIRLLSTIPYCTLSIVYLNVVGWLSIGSLVNEVWMYLVPYYFGVRHGYRYNKSDGEKTEFIWIYTYMK